MGYQGAKMIVVGRYRIRRLDEWNIVVEEFKAGGRPHPNGNIAKDKWVNRGYFGRMDAVASYLMAHLIDMESVV